MFGITNEKKLSEVSKLNPKVLVKWLRHLVFTLQDIIEIHLECLYLQEYF